MSEAVWKEKDSAQVIARKTKLTQVGDPPRGANPREAEWFRSMTARINAHFGTGASLGDRAVTVRDLLEGGFATLPDGGGSSGGGGSLPLIPIPPKLPDETISEVPPAPINFVVDAGLTSLILSWDVAGGLYSKVGYTEIYAADSNTFADKVFIGQTTARVYSDPVGSTGRDRWYWIRFIGKGSTPLAGPFFSASGVHGKTGEIDGIDLSGLLIEAANIADGAVIASKIADAVLTFAKFASGLEPVGLLAPGDPFPDPVGYAGPKVLLREADGKIYRLVGSSWVAGVSAADILGQLQAGQLALNSVTAGVVAAGAITATEIAAGAIRAQHLLITASSLVPDTNFAAGANGWEGFLVRRANTHVDVPPGCPVPFASKFNHRVGRYAVHVPIAPGQSFRAHYVCNRSGTAQSIGFAAEFYDADDAHLSSVTDATSNSGWVTRDFTFVAPPNAKTMVVGPFIDIFTVGVDYAWFGELTVVRMADAELIVDGAVTATKVAAEAIVAGKIAANAIAAFNIIAGSITGDRIAASTITAVNILVGTITGDRIAANTITATNILARTIQAIQIAANTITAYEIQANAISADRLTVGAMGVNANMLKNSDFTEYTGTNSGPTSLKDWSWASNIPGAIVGRNYEGGRVWNVGAGGAYLVDVDTSVSGGFNLIASAKVKVQPGYPIEASVFLAFFRCIAVVDLEFLRSDGAAATGGGGTGYANIFGQDAGAGTVGGAGGPSSMVRAWGKTIAPSDADTMSMRIFKYPTYGADPNGSYLFVHRAFATVDGNGQASAANQSPWRDAGLTTIDGRGIVTNSVTADAIQAGAVTAPKINVTALSQISPNIGIVVSGVLRNAANTAAIDLDASGSQDFIRVGNYGTQYDGSFNPNIAFRADGSAYFSREVVSMPRRVASGSKFLTYRPRVDFKDFGVLAPNSTTSIAILETPDRPVARVYAGGGGNEGGGGGSD